MCVAAQHVFDNCNIVNKILSTLDYPMVYSLYGINKTVFTEAKSIYEKKHNDMKKLFTKIYENTIYKYRKSLIMREKFIWSSVLMSDILEYKLWPFLLGNPYLASNLFFLWIDMRPYSAFYKNDFKKLFNKDYDTIRKQMGEYIHFDYTEELTMSTMRRLVSFKGIPKAYSMSKQSLVRHLRRSTNQLYYW